MYSLSSHGRNVYCNAGDPRCSRAPTVCRVTGVCRQQGCSRLGARLGARSTAWSRRAGRCGSSGLCRGTKGRALAVPCIMQTAPSPYADVSSSEKDGINSSRAYKAQRLDSKLLNKISLNLVRRNKDLVKRATCGSFPLNILFLMFLFTVKTKVYKEKQ